MRTFAIICLLTIASFARPAFGATDTDTLCRPSFGSACSKAVGDWLPRIPGVPRSQAKPTTVADEIVDPAGQGEERFLTQRGISGGTFFVYGEAGPPRGHAVYDRVHRIALYDEGCCSWHHVVAAANTPVPPKSLVSRSLSALHTKHGLRLGDPSRAVMSIFGPAIAHAVAGAPSETTISYIRMEPQPAHSSSCDAMTTFLFAHDRLRAMDFMKEC